MRYYNISEKSSSCTFPDQSIYDVEIDKKANTCTVTFGITYVIPNNIRNYVAVNCYELKDMKYLWSELT